MRVLVHENHLGLFSIPIGDYEVVSETESAYKLKDFINDRTDRWVEKNGNLYICEVLKEKIGESNG